VVKYRKEHEKEREKEEKEAKREAKQVKLFSEIGLWDSVCVCQI